VHDLAVPALRRLGRDERELDRILVDTPRRLLTLTEPRRADVMTRNT
jgi:predicted metal-dependent phosphotriesterase family hydrolase